MDGQELRVAHEILAYLMEHPDAQDTREGIADWWLLEQCIRRRCQEVDGAVKELVAAGFVTERIGADGRVRYQLNREKLTQIRKLVENDRRV
ncbi:MAG TPA: hypothetical protein VGC93_05770 [Thermoanaerobaculia bacterium]